ncbi:hypothetical protein Gogos_019958 [Gossypium gossypioides]|uniref:Uncharacterized protein n=2 Tax=Gossypium gossypioides TaxID=34282 RepID=A0A7J9D7G5_GOSGO|nr:hypothetical protein [Gossypium gossypioides]
MTTLEYSWWWGKRVNDNIPMSNQEDTRPIEEHLQVITSELEIIKQDFEKMSSELRKKIEQLEEENMRLGLDVDIQKLEIKKLRKGKNKAEEDLDSLKTDYKKLHLSIRTAGLGKTSEQWRQEIKQKMRADQWERKFQDDRAREDALEKNLLENQNEKAGLRVRVAKLEKSLYQYRSRNSVIELRNNEYWKEQLQRSQCQVRDRDYIMGEAVAQIQEVADHLQTLTVQADILSLKYESELDRCQELAWLLKKVKTLSINAKSYM